jgi:hypothetical protein
MWDRLIFAAVLCGIATLALAHQSHAPAAPALAAAPKAFAVRAALGEPPREVSDLRFGDIYKSPVGPRGLEATERLTQLDGQRVRLVGYMVRQEIAGSGGFVLSPLPLTLGDADEGMADDLPPSAVLVELPGHAGLLPPHMPGLIQVTGRLRVGAAESAAAPGRTFPARIELDARLEKILAKANK